MSIVNPPALQKTQFMLKDVIDRYMEGEKTKIKLYHLSIDPGSCTKSYKNKT